MSVTTAPRSRPATLAETTMRRWEFSRLTALGPSASVTSASSDTGTFAPEGRSTRLWRIASDARPRSRPGSAPPRRRSSGRRAPGRRRCRASAVSSVLARVPVCTPRRVARARSTRMLICGINTCFSICRSTTPGRFPSPRDLVGRGAQLFEVVAEDLHGDLRAHAREQVVEPVRDGLADVDDHARNDRAISSRMSSRICSRVRADRRRSTSISV